MEKFELSNKNYIALAVLTTFLIIGILGGVAEQKWAENIYTFITIVVTILLAASALVKTEFKPIKQFVGMYSFHILFCVAMGWWWLCICWLVATTSLMLCINNFITTKEKDKSEDKN